MTAAHHGAGAKAVLRSAARPRTPAGRSGEGTTSDAGAWRWPILAAALVAAVVAAGYLHTLHYPFHFDDFDWIRDNPALAPPLDLAAIWNFRPSRFVADLTFALSRITTGDSPASYRWANLLIHWLVALLVGWLGAELARAARSRRPETVGVVAALLFAAHPLATQSVTYLTQRITALAALLVLASVAAFLRARSTAGSRGWVVSWALALAAALTKEMSVALPVAVIAMEAWLRSVRAPGRAGVARLAPYFLIVPLVVWTAQHPLGPEQRVAGGLRESADIGRLAYLLTQMTVIPRYLGLAVWPAGQCIDPVPPLRASPDAAVLAGLGLIVALTVAALASRARAPLALAGWGWFLVTLAPESSVIPIGDLMMEQRAYLPLAGLCWAAAAALAGLEAQAGTTAARGGAGAGGRKRPEAGEPGPPGGSRAAVLPAAALVVALTAVTHARNRVWRDELSLWADSVAKAPASARAQNNLGLALEAAGRAPDAERAWRAAIAAEPAHVFARVNLGRLYGRTGRTDDALRVLLEAESLSPEEPLVLNNLGTAWWAKGDTARAAAHYLRALEIAPGSRYPAANLASMRSGRPAP